ncbi:hypothetical protein ABIA13_006426 [Sinorhizobium fredii]
MPRLCETQTSPSWNFEHPPRYRFPHVGKRLAQRDQQQGKAAGSTVSKADDMTAAGRPRRAHLAATSLKRESGVADFESLANR